MNIKKLLAGKGGYLDEITTSAGTTTSYAVWNQTTIEIRSETRGTSGQTVITRILRSTAG